MIFTEAERLEMMRKRLTKNTPNDLADIIVSGDKAYTKKVKLLEDKKLYLDGKLSGMKDKNDGGVHFD